jgi:hypothetical protein
MLSHAKRTASSVIQIRNRPKKEKMVYYAGVHPFAPVKNNMVSAIDEIAMGKTKAGPRVYFHYDQKIDRGAKQVLENVRLQAATWVDLSILNKRVCL